MHFLASLLISASFLSQPTITADPDSLAKIILKQDSLFFSVGFNQCDTGRMSVMLDDGFTFMHDEVGEIGSKNEFVSHFQRNVCGLGYNVRRELDQSTARVYPLYQRNQLYGAVQSGIHYFYRESSGKPSQLTGQARFTNFWRHKKEGWKMATAYSYEHRNRNLTSAPDFDDRRAVTRWMDAHGVPGMVVGILREGELVDTRAYGELRKGVSTPVDAVFNVASLTKLITTVLTLKLVSLGQWDLDESLSKYWVDPDVQADPRAELLTTRHILSHRTGFPNWRWLTKEKKLQFAFTPGSAYQYSGEGFEYLRKAIEAKTKKAFDTLADELLFDPLDMKSTQFVLSDQDSPKLAQPHDVDGNIFDFAWNKTPNAADFLTTTVGDFGSFLAAILRKDLLSPTVYDSMLEPHSLTKPQRHVGLGWFIYDSLSNGQYALSHGGDDPGYHSIVFLLPQSQYGLIILTNSDNGPKLYGDILKWQFGALGQDIIRVEME